MYDLVVLGGGSGGLNVATAAARVGAKVALIEKYELGGECTHSACVPSKALIQAARVAHLARRAGEFGVRVGSVEVDFGAVMARIRRVIDEFAGSDSGDGLRAKGINVYRGSPRFEAYDTVIVDGSTRVEGRRFVIATGSRPEIPPIPGLEEAGYLDNRTVWDLTERPDSLLIIGAGASGLEFGQAFRRLGAEVTILDQGPHILPKEDPEVAARLRASLEAEGIKFFLNVEVGGVVVKDGKPVVRFRDRTSGAPFEASRSRLFVAAGRLANVEGLNLDAIGVHADPRSGIAVDDYLQTHCRHVYAIGDVTGRLQYTHAAEREAAIVLQNAVLKLSRRLDDRTIPRTVFTDPELASVGRTESEALAEDPEARVFRAEVAELDRARIDGVSSGLAKVVVTPGGKILGASLCGPEAGTVLQEFVLAMEQGASLGDLAEVVHSYPTYAGIARTLANQFAATRLERGFVRSALKWFYGFAPGGGAEDRGGDAETVPAGDTHH